MQPAKYCFEIMSSSESVQQPREAMKRFARLFIARLGSRAIAVGMHMNENDMWYENDSPIVLNAPFTAEDLGRAVAQAMGKTDRRAWNARDAKLTDWPAFKASGERSIRKFEGSFIEISIQSANASNLVVIVTGNPEKDAVLQVTSTMSTSVVPAELGARVLRVYEACRDRRL